MDEYSYDESNYYSSGIGSNVDSGLTYDVLTTSSMTARDMTLIVIYSIITAIGLLANGVVLFVLVAGNEIGKTVTTIFILQLTLADTIFLFTLPVFAMQKVMGSWSFGSGLCKICQTIKFFNYYAGIFFLMVMSVDRYVAVAYSTRSLKIRTRRRTYIFSLCVWVCAGLMSLPILLFAKTDVTSWDKSNVFCKLIFPGYEATDRILVNLRNNGSVNEVEYVFESDDDYNGTMEYDDQYYSQYYNDVEETFETHPNEKVEFQCNHQNQPTSYTTWLVINFVVAFILPFFVIVVSYLKIIRHLQTAEQRAVHTASNRSAKMRRRVTRMVAALVIGFATCWLPHHVYNIIRIAGFQTTVNICYAIDEFLVALAFSNSAINPILYTFLGNSFSQRFQTATESISRKFSVRRRSSQPPISNGNSASESGVAKRILAKQRRESRALMKNPEYELNTFKPGQKYLQSQTKLTDV